MGCGGTKSSERVTSVPEKISTSEIPQNQSSSSSKNPAPPRNTAYEPAANAGPKSRGSSFLKIFSKLKKWGIEGEEQGTMFSVGKYDISLGEPDQKGQVKITGKGENTFSKINFSGSYDVNKQSATVTATSSYKNWKKIQFEMTWDEDDEKFTGTVCPENKSHKAPFNVTWKEFSQVFGGIINSKNPITISPLPN